LAHGDLSGALAEAADVAALTERLGKSLWARAPVDGLRLQALHLMGAPEEVLEQAQALLENLEQAPPEPDMTPADRTGATETILMAAYTAAMALRRFPQALEFNQRIHQDRQAGGSPAPPASAARFYDCSPLIELGRLDEAQQILDDSQRFFEETRNDAMMGFALNIRARLESERGHHGEALTAARNALRFMYRLGEPAATAETHLLLAVQMRACGADPREAVAHDFAAALLSAATGFSVHPEFTMGMLIAAAVHERGVRVLPADLDELIARVERVPGARLGDRLAALIPEEASRLRAFTETATEAAEHAWNMRGRGPLRSLGGPGAPPPRPGKPRTTTAAGRDAQRDARDAILAARRAFGDDHPSTLFARHALGRALTAQGRLAEAEAELRAVADARARLLGADHPLVLSVRAGRSLVLRDLGHFAEAEAECANLAAAHTRVSGPDHLETLGARSNLVIVLNASGKLAEAEAEARTVVAGSTRVLGPDDRLTLAARANLALSCLNQGKLAEAEIEARSVLDGYGRIASRDDEDSLIVRTLLTRCLHKQGRIAEAEAQARTARAAAVRVLGIGHQVTRRASGVLALILADQDYSAAAEREIRVIVRAYDRSLGAEHPEALGLRQSLADFLAKGGALEAASRERDALDAAARRARQPDHPSVKAIRRLNAKATLNLHQERAAELLGRGDFAAVRSQFQALAADAARLPGPDSQGAAMVGRVNAACMLIRLGNAADAAAELEEIVSACHAAGGQQRDIEMTARTNLATALADLGRYPQAAAHERVVLGWLSRTYGPDHPDTAASRDFLANLLRQDGAPDAGAGR
jgi:tetratricopeptide (TPR) repeat protein